MTQARCEGVGFLNWARKPEVTFTKASDVNGPVWGRGQMPKTQERQLQQIKKAKHGQEFGNSTLAAWNKVAQRLAEMVKESIRKKQAADDELRRSENEAPVPTLCNEVRRSKSEAVQHRQH
jgi:predicted TIM-barrel fold metal-dependent hydrolase